MIPLGMYDYTIPEQSSMLCEVTGSGSVDLDMGFSGEPLFRLLHWLLWETEASLHLNCSRQAVAEGDLTNDCDATGETRAGNAEAGYSSPGWKASLSL